MRQGPLCARTRVCCTVLLCAVVFCSVLYGAVLYSAGMLVILFIFQDYRSVYTGHILTNSYPRFYFLRCISRVCPISSIQKAELRCHRTSVEQLGGGGWEECYKNRFWHAHPRAVLSCSMLLCCSMVHCAGSRILCLLLSVGVKTKVRAHTLRYCPDFPRKSPASV